MKIKERGLVYKTSRISYIENYVIIALILIFLYFFYSYFGFDILTSFSNGKTEDMVKLIVLLVSISMISFLAEEPAIERLIRQYIITKDEVVKIEGFLRKKRTAIPYQSIADIKMGKGIIGRIFNFGNVVVSGFKDEIIIKGVRNPDEVYRIINHRIRRRQVPRLRKIRNEENE
jgi:membrane protein YdbS with pleckstrin-like domain